MEEENRVLLAAAELGRADIIGKAIESLIVGSPVNPGEAQEDRQRRLVSAIRESDGASALHLSSMNGHIDASRALLRLGAAPEVQGTGPLSGKTPWDVATTAVKQVYANELFMQVAHGEEAKVLALLRAGVRADATDGGPRSDAVLHWAACTGNASLCSILLESGAKLDHCNCEGATALHEASKCGHAGVVSLLLERGANPHALGTGGEFKDKTPFQVSSSEAVSEALRSPPRLPRPLGPPAPGPAAPFSDSRLSEEEPDDRRRPPGASVGSSSSSSSSSRRSNGPARFVDGGGGAGRGGAEAAAVAKEEEHKRDSGREGRVAAGGAGGGAGAGAGRALPMLWPPPKSCAVVRDEVCRIPPRVVVVLPAGEVAGPATPTFRTLQAALSSYGIAMTCTRGRCPPGRGGEFFVTLACGGLQGACAASSSSSVGAGGGQGFSVVIGSGMVRVAGTGEPGLYYGVRTLCQMFRFYARPPPPQASGGEPAGLDIPCCILRDEPDVARRSLVVDVRHPLVPTLPSLVRTIEAASRSRINVLQLTVTRETAAWLARQDEDSGNQATPTSRRGGGVSGSGSGTGSGSGSGGAGEENGLPGNKSGEEGAWGWGALGTIGAFCREHFMELVLGWAVVPGDESREAQREAVQLISPLSRQFQSDEMHLVFEEGVRLAWGVTPDPVLDRPEEDRRPEPGGTGFLRGLSASSGSGDAPHSAVSPVAAAAAVTAAGQGQEEGLSLTRFLSNVVVACNQGTIVLDGVPPAAVASLQGVGYLPVELAFSLGTDQSSGISLTPLSGDGMIDGRSDNLSMLMLLGPVHLGYVCAGHRGPGSGRREEACLSIHKALADVAKAAAAARGAGCGIQLRARTTTSSGALAPAAAAGAGDGATATDACCAGTNLYFPEILSDALEFLGAGLCWRLDKACAALHLSSHGGGCGNLERGVVSSLAGEGPAGKRGAPQVVGGLPLQGPSDPAVLFINHVLRIDTGTMEAASASQLVTCLGILLESWNPVPASEGGSCARNDEEAAARNLDDALWAIHARGNGPLEFTLDDNTRVVLKALHRRYLRLEESFHLVLEDMKAAKAPPAVEARPLLLEICRAVRLLKISGRLLQAAFNQVSRPDQALTLTRGDSGSSHLSSTVPSPSSGPGPSSQQGRGGRASTTSPHSNGQQSTAHAANGGGEEGTQRNMRNSLAQLSSSTRLDFANRYLEEFRALSACWDSSKHLPMGRKVLHASLSGLLRNLAYDESAKQMEALCEQAIYNE